MKIEHLAIWVTDLQKMKTFYERFFNGRAGELYYNPTKNFSSFFLSFDSGCRLELMHRPDISERLAADHESLGLAHFALSVGSEHAVNVLTKNISDCGYTVIGQPRTTGDGYYESVVLDPEQNTIEITV